MNKNTYHEMETSILPGFKEREREREICSSEEEEEEEICILLVLSAWPLNVRQPGPVIVETSADPVLLGALP